MNPFIIEEWRALEKIHIPELYSETRYSISNIGRVYDNDNLKFISIYKPKGNNYEYVSLNTIYGSKKYYIHRLVALVFIDNPNPKINTIVNHINGIKDWNTYTNLEWTSYSGNNKHAYDNNLKLKGEACSMSKLTEKEVMKVCELLETNMSIADIAREVDGNILASDVYDILHRKCWVDISNNYNFYQGDRIDNLRNFDKDKVRILCQYFQDHPKPIDRPITKHCEEALKACNYDYSWQSINTLRKVYIRYTYNSISKDYIF